MAERIDFSKVDRNDPRFLQVDPDNPNTNISGSRFDPTDPTADIANPASASARYNQFLQTANIGDTFNFGDGTSVEFTGFNKMGTPIIQTIESPERTNWRDTMSTATSFADAVSKLKAAGFDDQMAQFLVTKSGTEFSDQAQFMAANRGTTAAQIGAMADGTPIYGYGADGKPVTSPTGAIYSTTSASDAVAKFTSGSAPLSTGSSTTATGVTGTDEKKSQRISAYNLLYDEFDRYGLGTLVSDIKNILVEGSLDPAEFALKVRGTDAYKARFIANEARLAKGLKALSPAQYIALEDQYQEVMRQYGLPESYYAKTGTGVQEGFRKLIENDVSNVELEDRISTAQKRVLNANPEVTQALKQFYPDITNADILAYTLDPKNAIEQIKRKVTAAEIGGAAMQAGLQTGLPRAEQLQAAGVTKDTAEKGFGTIAGGLQRGSQLASIYGENPYTQTTAEQEVFGLAGKTEAEKQRKKLTGLEKAAFGGQTGLTSGALVRDRAGAY
jgi:hypothetical protein